VFDLKNKVTVVAIMPKIH